MPIEAYPLTWPRGWKRMPAGARKNGTFNRKEPVYRDGKKLYDATKNLTVADGVTRVLAALEAMGIDRQDVILSTNVRTRLDGMPRSGEKEPDDPGAAVYWQDAPGKPMRCMAIDRYTVVADNLAAIGATLDAMRAIERHGGAEILDRAFTGFNALPAQTAGPSWWEVLQVDALADEATVQGAYRRLAKIAHSDSSTGSNDAMVALNIARDQALAAARGRG